MFAIISLVLGVVLVMLLFHIKSLNKDIKNGKDKSDKEEARLHSLLAQKVNMNMDLQLKVNKLTQELDEHKNVQTSRIVTEIKSKTTKPRVSKTKNKDSE